MTINVSLLYIQKRWSIETFGPISFKDHRGPIDHLRKEIEEILECPGDVEEWADALLLVFDGAMRAGHAPSDILNAYTLKLTKNMHRKWPDWRGTDPIKAIEHIQ